MTSAEHLLMPVVVFAVLGLMALLLRWSQKSGRTRSAASRNSGMLVPVARFTTRVAAERVATQLCRAGIRATSAATVHGTDVLVWPEEYGQARLRIERDDH